MTVEGAFMDDWQQLQHYVKTGSEEAFNGLVTRYGDMVYSACLRELRDPSLAEDAAQAVFIILAKKAKSIRRGIVLSGWLFRTAKYTSSNTLTVESRRKKHEKEASIMALAKPKTAEEWARVAPVLNEALMKLSEKNRNSILLRFFEGKSHAEVGTALGISKDAAERRVARAVEKLRKFFLKRGVALSGAFLATLLSANAVQAAPAGFAAGCGAAAIGGTAAGAAVSGVSCAIAEKAMSVMLWAKVKLVTAVCLVTVLAGGAGAVGLKAALERGAPDSSREMLLMGFEQDEVMAWAPAIERSNDELAVRTKPPVRYQPFWQKLRLRRGDASQGEWALTQYMRYSFGNGDDTPALVYGGPNDDVFRWYLAPFCTAGWFRDVLPADWSAYDRLRLDVKSTESEFEFFVGLEDEECEPPVERRFAVEAGEWTTVELDLKELAAARGLDLTKMVNLWLFPLRNTGCSEVRIDNIRLARADAPTALRVVRDTGPMTIPTPPEKILKAEPVAAVPDRSPVLQEKPAVLDVARLNKDWSKVFWSENHFRVSRRGIAAFDNNHIALCCWTHGLNAALHNDDKMYQSLIWTTDGGKTWRGPEGVDRPRYLRQHGSASGIETAGPDMLFVSAAGDDHFNAGPRGLPTARLRFRAARFTGRGWTLTPDVLVSRDPRRSWGTPTAVRLKSGRIWAAWYYETRMGIGVLQVQAKHSDDGGKQWHSWRPGKTGALTPPLNRPYGALRPWLVPYGEHVACFWEDRWSAFDGRVWSPPGAAGKPRKHRYNSFATTGGPQGELFAYATDFGAKGLALRWDGKQWVREKVPGITCAPGLLTVAGGRLVLIAPDRPVQWKRKTYASKLLMSIRNKDGTWTDARAIVTEPAGIKNVAVPAESPPNFVPVAWTGPPGQKWVKVLSVPLPETRK